MLVDVQQSLIECPNGPATVLYFSGCNFRCPFCHNPELVLGQKVTSYGGDPVAQIMANLDYSENVVFTGGEPLLSVNLRQIISIMDKLPDTIHYYFETNGMLLSDSFSTLIRYSDNLTFIIDIKTDVYDMGEYSILTGTDLRSHGYSIVTSLYNEICNDIQIKKNFRTTVIKGIHTPETISRIATAIKDSKTGFPYTLNNFKPGNCLWPPMNQHPVFTDEEFAELCEICKSKLA